MTVILAGASLVAGIEALAEICRVLQVEGIPLDPAGAPANELAERQLDDRIRVLLPLILPAPMIEAADGSAPAMEQLVRALPAGMDQHLLEVVIAASSGGEQAVNDAVAAEINRAFEPQDVGETA